MVTLKEIAQKCNVSVATVSNILNGKPKVSEETKKAVMEVVAEMGYQPNYVAQGLRRQKTHTIGIIADEMAIGMVNQKTTAVRIIPVIGKGVGETVEFGGLLGYAPIMPVNQYSCDAFVNRGGRIPAPIHSFKN